MPPTERNSIIALNQVLIRSSTRNCGTLEIALFGPTKRGGPRYGSVYFFSIGQTTLAFAASWPPLLSVHNVT